MFEHEKTAITYDEMKNLLCGFTDEYIKKMLKENLIDFYMYNNKRYYIFKMQYMSDYLIVRYLKCNICQII